MVARAPAQVLRLSMMYALLDMSTTIRKEHLEAALEIWRYCEVPFGSSSATGLET
jgi:hypothetical protein